MHTWPFLTIFIGNHIYENLACLEQQESVNKGISFHFISDTAENMCCYRVSFSSKEKLKELVSMTFSSSVSVTNQLMLQLRLR